MSRRKQARPSRHLETSGAPDLARRFDRDCIGNLNTHDGSKLRLSGRWHFSSHAMNCKLVINRPFQYSPDKCESVVLNIQHEPQLSDNFVFFLTLKLTNTQRHINTSIHVRIAEFMEIMPVTTRFNFMLSLVPCKQCSCDNDFRPCN